MNRDSRIYCQQGPESIASSAPGSLNGLRFVFKDLFDVKGYPTGAGNPAWLDTHEPAQHTSPILSALLDAGALCVGRVQTDELAYSLNGQNRHYGTPVNPRAPECIPGGSSSGSAVAVASGDCDFSLGTDTGGSVRVPASYCGLFGLRPTLGALDLDHCFELAKSFDTAGLFSQKLSVLNQVWQALKPKQDNQNHFTRVYLDKQHGALMGAGRMKALIEALNEANVELIQGDFLAEQGQSLVQLSELFRTIQGFEIIAQHDQWLAEHLDSLDASITQRVEWARTITAQDYQKAKQQQAHFSLAIQQHIIDNAVYWLLPTTPSGPPRLDSSAQYLAQYRIELMGLTSVAGLTGLPQLHIPLTQQKTGPIGYSLLGPAHSEYRLMAFADQLTN
ncbi:amidase [Vibrio sp. WXL210]|uniref:amidase n=1 Tax=Vibrio sp. WXL210 TaxID=3450709 RepID=UPI003EC6B767